ncbi:ankyrin repeat-containing domain protein [Globomyces pollinis-pini]|nr:ankyrin repeat-containing domain protein [Globomyces pollinis-pini]
MNTIINLPVELLELIASHLPIIDYHGFIFLIPKLTKPMIPLLTWEAYLESHKQIKNNTIKLICKPLWDCVRSDRLEVLYNHQQYRLLETYLDKNRNSVPLSIQQELFFRAAIDGEHQLLNVILQNPNIDPSSRDNLNKRLNSTVRYSKATTKYLNLYDRPSEDENDAICYAALNGHHTCLKLLLQDKSWACYYGYVDCLNLLLSDSRVDPTASENEAFLCSAERGHVECLKILLDDPRVDPSYDHNYAIRIASKNGQADILQILLKDSRVDPSDNGNYAIQIVSQEGHEDCMKILLQDPRVDPSASYNYPLRLAIKYGHMGCINVLLSDSRTKMYGVDYGTLHHAVQRFHQDFQQST